MQRRDFLVGSALMMLAGSVGRSAEAKARQPLRILVLGGTQFVGLHMVERALERGHAVTIFTRGQHEADFSGPVTHLIGDLDGKLEALAGGTWDAVIDTSGYVPRHVRLSAELLAPHAGHYLYISSVSVYADLSKPCTEDSALATIADPNVEKVTPDTYGALKALCEQEAQKAFAGRATVVRPGLIVGPHDYTDRFTYWPVRMTRGGQILAPGTARDHIQFIDARDLAAFCVQAIEHRSVGVYNALSPPGLFTMGALLGAARTSALELAKPERPITVTWVPADFLAAQKVEPWSDLPVWLPATGENAAFAETSAARALRGGLKTRPLVATARDTLSWYLSRPEGERAHLAAGLTPQRESEVLSAWQAQHAPVGNG